MKVSLSSWQGRFVFEGKRKVWRPALLSLFGCRIYWRREFFCVISNSNQQFELFLVVAKAIVQPFVLVFFVLSAFLEQFLCTTITARKIAYCEWLDTYLQAQNLFLAAQA